MLPCLREVGGIVCRMSYPSGFYRRYGPRCRRVMAIYASLTFSHHLPSVTARPDQDKQRVTVRDAAPLLATRCVLSYQASSTSAGARVVVWSTFGDLIGAVFVGEDIPVQHSTLEEFNRADADTPAALPSRSSSFLPHSYLFGERLLSSPFSTRRRYCVSTRRLFPSFYHASQCCKQHFAGSGVRHELDCYDKRTMLAQKRAKQKEARKQQVSNNAKELTAIDQGMAAAAETAAVADANTSASSSHAAPRPSPCPSPSSCSVLVQEMQNTSFSAHFRVSFIGVSCM